MSVGDLTDREERPAYVRFEKRPVEDKLASREAGYAVYRDVNYVLVTPPYSKDLFEQKAETWLENVKRNVASGRTPEKWLEHWQESYERWQKGEEVPLNGTSVKNWSAISPANVKTLISSNIQTIEDLAAINDEGLRRLGMGGMELKNKAMAYVQAAKDTGPLVMENAALKGEVDQLKGTIASLTDKIEILGQRLQAVSSQPLIEVEKEPITADDILDAGESSPVEVPGLVEQYEAKFGKKPHHLMKEATIQKKLAEG